MAPFLQFVSELAYTVEPEIGYEDAKTMDTSVQSNTVTTAAVTNNSVSVAATSVNVKINTTNASSRFLQSPSTLKSQKYSNTSEMSSTIFAFLNNTALLDQLKTTIFFSLNNYSTTKRNNIESATDITINSVTNNNVTAKSSSHGIYNITQSTNESYSYNKGKKYRIVFFKLWFIFNLMIIFLIFLWELLH